jgi:SprT protein
MISNLLQKHIPEKSIPYCHSLWQTSPFKFLVTKKRETKLGDYRYHYQHKSHTITVNGDLNPYTFLVTYLHEVAHLKTQILYGSKVKPHGSEWKAEFKKILDPVMSEEIFPQNVLIALKHYLVNPKASSCSDIDLLKALGTHDEQTHLQYLSDVSIGDTFRFNKKYYKKESLMRTRAVCKELKSGRKYYISEAAQVEVLQKSLF